MHTITIKLPGESPRIIENGKTIAAVLQELNIFSAAVAAQVNGHPVDLNTPLRADCEVLPVGSSSDEGKEILRHSAAHVMAQAVKALYPGVKIAIGPSIENGFYYDFDYDGAFTPDDLDKIEKKMQEIIAQDLPFTRIETTRQNALKLFSDKNEPYKV